MCQRRRVSRSYFVVNKRHFIFPELGRFLSGRVREQWEDVAAIVATTSTPVSSVTISGEEAMVILAVEIALDDLAPTVVV